MLYTTTLQVRTAVQVTRVNNCNISQRNR